MARAGVFVGRAPPRTPPSRAGSASRSLLREKSNATVTRARKKTRVESRWPCLQVLHSTDHLSNSLHHQNSLVISERYDLKFSSIFGTAALSPRKRLAAGKPPEKPPGDDPAEFQTFFFLFVFIFHTFLILHGNGLKLSKNSKYLQSDRHCFGYHMKHSE